MKKLRSVYPDLQAGVITAAVVELILSKPGFVIHRSCTANQRFIQGGMLDSKA